MTRFAWRLSTWIVIALAVVAVLSHVCVLPHAHADEAATPAAHEHDENSGASDDGLHGASCEVVRTPGTQLPVIAVTFAPVPLHAEPVIRGAARAPDPVSRGPSPPLFLRHSALLLQPP